MQHIDKVFYITKQFNDKAYSNLLSQYTLYKYCNPLILGFILRLLIVLLTIGIQHSTTGAGILFGKDKL